MPLLIHNGPEAVRIRKSNNVSTWGNRLEDNRVEPVAKPAFDVPFKFKRNERIFTIGSCFARHVESELIKRGFRIPMRDLLAQPAFADVNVEVVNNFGTPSIYNELAWAFGAQDFDEADAFVEIGPDKFVDLHMINSIRPAPVELLRERRRGLFEATRMLSQCRVLIMTLGLVELWWDEQAQIYLNTAPLPSVLKKWPDRFSLHVLTFDECRDYLNRALDLCIANGPRNLQIVLTVSPVPMMQTHRRMDVMTANSYSKSVLRAVAEHVVAERGQVCYFPSYESVTYSDRRIAWMDDLVHVTRDIVAFNVERMVNAFTGRTTDTEWILPDEAQLPAEDAAALILAERANQARLRDDEAFFAEHRDAAATSPAFRLEYARLLADRNAHEDLVALLSDDTRIETRLLCAQSLMKLGEYGQAAAIAGRICDDPPKGDLHWRILIDATARAGTLDDLFAVERRWIEHDSRYRYMAKVYAGRALRHIRNHEAAIERFRDAVGIGEKTPSIAIQLADCLIATNRYREAIDAMDGVTGANDGQIHRLQLLRERAGRRLGKKAG